jgi:hypothetical protein
VDLLINIILIVLFDARLLFSGLSLHLLVLLTLLLPLGPADLFLLLLVLLLLHPLGVSLVSRPLDRVLENGWVEVEDQVEIPL